MAWLEVSLTLDADLREAAEAALEAAGALSVTLQDAAADTADEQAIFEPGVGETPLWPQLVLSALFEADTEPSMLLEELYATVPGLDPGQVSFQPVEDQDWTRAWMADFRPMRFGRRLWIFPSDEPLPDADPGRVVVRLDPGLAFGTGTHPTTALCLEWLDGLDLAGATLVDYGCGSGVLAIAAIKLGAAHVIGVDNDPQALIASADNARRNGVADRLELVSPEGYACRGADALVANILADPLIELAPRFADSMKPGAPIALSGLLLWQEDEVTAAYRTRFEDFASRQREEWLCIQARRRA